MPLKRVIIVEVPDTADVESVTQRIKKVVEDSGLRATMLDAEREREFLRRHHSSVVESLAARGLTRSSL